MKVLVVGGGIIGCAAALELARAGCRVTVFERATPGAEASSAAAGLLAPIDDSAETNFAQLALASWRLYPEVVRDLQARTGIDVEYVTRGTIYPTSATERRRDVGAWGDIEEFGVEFLDDEELHRLEPALSPKISRAILVRGDHWLNNQRLVLAYAQGTPPHFRVDSVVAYDEGDVLPANGSVSIYVNVKSSFPTTIVATGKSPDDPLAVSASGSSVIGSITLLQLHLVALACTVAGVVMGAMGWRRG